MFDVSQRWKNAYPEREVAMLVVTTVHNVREHSALEE